MGVTVFYSVENFRGAYALKRYRGWAEARIWTDEYPRVRPSQEINLFDLPDAAPGLTDGGLYKWKEGGFDPIMVSRHSHGFAVCEPFPFHLAFDGGEDLSPLAGAEKYLLLSDSRKNELDAFCEAVRKSNVIGFSSDLTDATENNGSSLNAVENTN